MNKSTLDLKAFTAKLTPLFAGIRRFRFVLFICFVAALYGFVLLRINSLSNTQPSPDAVSGQVKAAGVPHIDQSVVQQLESLHNNSVNVQALFDQARNNPFQ